MSTNKKVKKRGRKPKGKIINYQQELEDKRNSEEEPIITHLPISLTDVMENKVSGVFIKNEEELKTTEKETTISVIEEEKESDIDRLKRKIRTLEKKLFKLEMNKNSLTTVHKLVLNNENKNISCWWCKHEFCTPAVSLPESYYDRKYYTIGCFCSYNCALSFNLDLSDDKTWLRTSLLNKLYYDTYNENSKIVPAPSWFILKKFGGILDIEDYRKELVVNSRDYILLKPPLISRLTFIEENLENNDSVEVPINTIKKFFDNSDKVLKRSKPLKTSIYSLESTMGLKRKKKNK